MQTFEDWCKKATKEELKNELIRYNEFWLDWESFLISELGEVTYHDLCTNYARTKTNADMKKLGMSEEEIKEFNDKMEGNKRKCKKA